MNLDGAISVVTGGGSGLGAALVDAIARRGGRPVVVDLAGERVETASRALETLGLEPAGWTCDVADRACVATTFSEIGSRFGRVDLLVNCAGRSMLRSFLEMSDEDVDWILGPNLLGVVNCIRAAAPLMPHGSRIVNITSVSARVPTPGEAFYSAVKAAAASLSESLRIEFRHRGIGVTLALPGEMSTNLFAEHPSWEQRLDYLRRLEVAPELVARAVLRAAERDRDQVTVPWSMAASLFLYRLAPALFRRGVERFYYRPLEKRIRT